MTKKIDNTSIAKAVVKKFERNRDLYKKVAELLEKHILPELFPDAQKVSARSKEPDSIAGKVLKKYIQLGNANKIYEKFTDFVGARVIFLRRNQVDATDARIRKFFTVDDHNSQNTAERLNDREFGYQSRHYIIRIDSDLPGKAENEFEISIPQPIKDTLEKNAPFFAELQVRTWLQHVWADLSHDSIYKGDRVIPRELMRSWNALAAILENVDEDIVRCLDQLEQYRKNSAYNIAEEVDKKIENMKIIAGVQLKLYRPDSLTKKERHHLTRSYDELLRLQKIKQGSDDDLQKLIAEIGTALKVSTARKKDLTNPKELLDFLSKFNSKAEYADPMLVPLLNMALERCENMISSNSELPWAFAGKAFFNMLLLEEKMSKEEKKERVGTIYDSVLRLIDLCNERSVANLDKARRIATPDSRAALEKLLEIFNKWSQNIYLEDGQAPVGKCVQKMLELGKYAHGISLELPKESQPTPAVIIAGGCREIDCTPELEDFKDLFRKALCGKNEITFYTGTGETGICGLPFGTNTNVKRFGLAGQSDSQNFRPQYSKNSIWEALMEWEELKKNGYRFDDVALVGFGLGDISRLECKIGLAFGARVTVIGHKNYLSYKRTFEGIPYWSDHPSLVRLPLIRGTEPANRSFSKGKKTCCRKWHDNGFPEPMMLRVFMLFDPFHEAGYNKIDDSVYLIHQIKQIRSVIKLSDLQKNYKGFSAQHRYHSFSELYKDIRRGKSLKELERLVSTELEKIPFPGSKRQDLKKWLDELHNAVASIIPINYEFGEREHARWYIERWLQGTRYGDNKIDQNVSKDQVKNPCMVAWFDLDDDTIEKDTDFIIRYLVANYINKFQKGAKQVIRKLFK